MKTLIIGDINSIPLISTETFTVLPSESQCPPIKFKMEIYYSTNNIVISSTINSLIEMIDISFYVKGL